jgi:hypothetical protein
MIKSIPSCYTCAKAIKKQTHILPPKIKNRVKTSVDTEPWNSWTDAEIEDLTVPMPTDNKSLKLKIPSDDIQLTPFEDSPNFKTPSPYKKLIIENENPYGRKRPEHNGIPTEKIISEKI